MKATEELSASMHDSVSRHGFLIAVKVLALLSLSSLPARQRTEIIRYAYDGSAMT
ncbi:MAG: hypothetical protein IAA97_07365 [Spirochaetes bacterium]|uniref:Uncharacterized protein n=1 Tax=Candidatus Ornithospirochaeta stercoripullorum TaxID=2840899 RepID=A0A9D9H6L8_9SPIO|nr:hypothetical protein [Candidatus Ornithospirochaeta stercoripullorum]